MLHNVNFKQSKTCLNSEFSFSLSGCLNKANEPKKHFYVPIGGGRTDGFMPFQRTLARNTKSFVQDLGSGNQFHFIGWLTLREAGRYQSVCLNIYFSHKIKEWHTIKGNYGSNLPPSLSLSQSSPTHTHARIVKSKK